MKLVSQLSYRANHVWRPQAKILEESEIALMGVCFSWGGLDLSSKILENVRYFLEAHLNQSEITNPFGFEASLSGLENALRSGCSMANDVIYRLINKASLSGGVECALVAKRGREIAVLQVGQPHVFLIRQQIVIPLITSLDLLPTNFRSGEFLPSQLLGVNQSCYPQLRSFKYEKGDEIVFLAHSQLPGAIMTSGHYQSDDDLHPLFQQIANASPQCPFWLSKIRL